MKITLKIIGILLLIYLGLQILNLFQKNRTLLNSDFQFSPQGNSLLVSLNYPRKHQGQLYLIDLEGNVLKRVTKNNKDNLSPSFSNDGKKIVYVERQPKKEDSSTRVWIHDLQSRKNILALDSKFADYSPSFSKDGNKLVFSRSTRLDQEHMGFGKVWRGWNLFLLDLKTTGLTQLTSKEYYQAFLPKFINNDSDIIFYVEEGLLSEIKPKFPLNKLNLQTRAVEEFFEKKANYFKVLEDENKLFYSTGPLTRFEGGGYRLILADLKTGKETTLFSCTTEKQLGSFDISKDGSKVAFMTYSGDDRTNYHTQLFLLDVKTREVKEVIIKVRNPWVQVINDSLGLGFAYSK